VLKFNKMPPQEFNFDFLFDGTGAISNILTPPLPVPDQLDLFRTRSSNTRAISTAVLPEDPLGTLLFKGSDIDDIEFKLFKPDGTPLRAVQNAHQRHH